MARAADPGSREMSEDDSNDDSISITSSVVSEERETYVLEGIWAERNNDGVMEYLVKWDGYPEVRNTWETRESFQDEEDKTFKDWEEQKMRISRSYIKPFDVEAFEERWRKWQEATQKRKMHRRNKRIRMGLPVAPLEIESDEDEDTASKESLEESESDDERPTKRKRRLQPRTKKASSLSENDAMNVESSPESTTPASRQWDSKEQSALMNGLELLKGPQWTNILSMHHSILKEFTASDLENQARVVKNQFKESGRAIPLYLQSVPDKPLTKTTMKATNKIGKSSRNQSREQSIAKKTGDDDTDTSVDAPVEDLLKKNRTTSIKRANKPSSAARGTDQQSRKQAKPKAQEPAKRDKTTALNAAASISVNKPTSATPHAQTLDPRVATSQATARAPLSAASRPRAAPGRAPTAVPRGGIGRGPRRPKPLMKRSFYKPKTPVTGNLLSNWDKGKVRGNSSLALKGPARNTDGPTKAYDKHSIRRMTVMKGRTEPMPDVTSLHFIDPKDGKAVKEPVRRPSEGTNKTAYQMIQDSLKEAPQDTTTSNDGSWMDTMDNEITVEPSMTAPVQPDQAPKQAPQAPMKPVEPATKRVSIPLSAYMQRSQAPPPPPPAAPLAPMSAPASAPVPTPTRPNPLQQPPLPQPDRAESPREFVKAPQIASPSNITIQPRPQASSPPTGPLSPQDFKRPSSPKGLEKIIADMRRSGEYNQQTANHYGPDAPQAHNQMNSNDVSDIHGDMYSGPGRAMVGAARWRGLERPAKQLVLSSTVPRTGGRLEMWYSHMCTAADYEAHFHTSTSNYHGSGFVVPFHKSVAEVGAFAEILKLNVSGGVFLSNEFSMIIFPTNSEDWQFLDRHFPPVPGVALRFVVRAPIHYGQAKASEYSSRRQKIEKRIIKRGKEMNITGEKGINTVMRHLYEIDYSRLIQQAPPKISAECSKFFVLFPKEAKDEQDLIVQFLSVNNALEIYTYDPNSNDAAWSYFYQSVDAGVIIAHSSFWQYHLIPHFAHILKKSMNVWSLSLRRDPNMTHPHLTRLFPHGCMLLLTDSLILLRPRDAVRLLAWFRLRVLVDKPAGTWKIVTRPGLRNFCLNCCNERNDDEEGKCFVEIYQELVLMLDADELYDFDEDRPKDEAPIYCMPKIKSFNTKVGRRVDYSRNLDHAAIAKNDEVLVEFFAGWASCNIEHYRRFHIITGFEDASPYGKVARDRSAEKYSFLEIFHPDVFHAKIKVPSQQALDVLAAQKHKEIIAEYDRRDAEVDAASKRDDEESAAQEAARKKEWGRMCEGNLKLKEGYEALEREWSDEAEDQEDGLSSEWDEWSNDDSSSAGEGDVEMGGRGAEDAKEEEEMLTPSESSGISDSDDSSSEEGI